MPRFEISSPDGRRFEIMTPDGATQDDAIRAFQAQFNGQNVGPENSLESDNARADDLMARGDRMRSFLDKGVMDDITNPDPQTHYSSILPVARDEVTGMRRFTAPELVQDAMRGMIRGGQAARGQLPLEEAKRAGTESALATLGVGGAASFPLGAAGRESVELGMNVMRPVAKGATKAASAVAQPILDRIDPDGAIARVLAKRVMAQNPGMSLEDAIAQSQNYISENPGAVVADTGEAMRSLGRSVIQNTGETKQFAENVIGGRQATEKTRQVQNVRENVSNKDFMDVDAVADRAMEESSPFFQASFKANPSVSSKIIDNLLATPVGNQALATARERVQNRMAKMANPDPELTQQLNDLVARGEAAPSPGGVASGLKLETLDLIRQDLWDRKKLLEKQVAKGEARQGELTEMENIYNSFRDELVNADVTGRAGPNSTKASGGQYARGLGKYAEGAKLKDALENGAEFMKGNFRTTAQKFAKLSPKEKDAFRAGAADNLIGIIRADTSLSGLTPRQIMATIQAESAVKQKLELILPAREQLDRFMKGVERDLTFRKTNASRGGSSTASNLKETDDMASEVLQEGAGMVSDVAQGRMGSAATRAMRWASNLLQKAQMPEATRDRIGKLLYSQSADDQAEAFRLLRSVNPSDYRYTP